MMIPCLPASFLAYVYITWGMHAVHCGARVSKCIQLYCTYIYVSKKVIEYEFLYIYIQELIKIKMGEDIGMACLKI